MKEREQFIDELMHRYFLIDELMHRYFPDRYLNPKKKTEGKTMTAKPKRVGRKDREQYTTHISTAFAEEYIDHQEMQDRISAASKAVVQSDLDSLVEDLPSLPELRGEKIIPKKVRHWGLGVKGLTHLFSKDGHPVLAPLILLFLGFVTGIVPSVLLGNSWLIRFAATKAGIALLCVTGAVMILTAIARLVWALDEAS